MGGDRIMVAQIVPDTLAANAAEFSPIGCGGGGGHIYFGEISYIH